LYRYIKFFLPKTDHVKKRRDLKAESSLLDTMSARPSASQLMGSQGPMVASMPQGFTGASVGPMGAPGDLPQGARYYGTVKVRPPSGIFNASPDLIAVAARLSCAPLWLTAFLRADCGWQDRGPVHDPG
jgi:hypothetical protein